MFLLISSVAPIRWEYAAFPQLQDCTCCKSPLIFCLLQLVLSLSHDCADEGLGQPFGKKIEDRIFPAWLRDAAQGF